MSTVIQAEALQPVLIDEAMYQIFNNTESGAAGDFELAKCGSCKRYGYVEWYAEKCPDCKELGLIAV